MRASAGRLERERQGVGTAWWIGGRYLLTSEHCLRDSKGKSVRTKPFDVRFDLEGRDSPVRVRVRAMDRVQILLRGEP